MAGFIGLHNPEAGLQDCKPASACLAPRKGRCPSCGLDDGLHEIPCPALAEKESRDHPTPEDALEHAEFLALIFEDLHHPLADHWRLVAQALHDRLEKNARESSTTSVSAVS